MIGDITQERLPAMTSPQIPVYGLVTCTLTEGTEDTPVGLGFCFVLTPPDTVPGEEKFSQTYACGLDQIPSLIAYLAQGYQTASGNIVIEPEQPQ